MQEAYKIVNPDYKLSPYTGMTRQHYIDIAKYVLTRAFSYVDDINTPLTFPVPEGSKVYPQPDDLPWVDRALELEALVRTFTLASALIHADPTTEIKGINLQKYYALQLYRMFTPGNKNSLPMPQDLPSGTYCYTCEFGGLFETLFMYPDTIWPTYTKEQQDEMAITISAWAHYRTTQNNWRIFNILALSFLDQHGYEIDKDLLKSHLMWIVSYHSGNGWFLEQTYNYYTISLFVVYTEIWCKYYGREHYPEIAAIIDECAEKQMEAYPNFFARDGRVNMWARSIIYRTWISGGFPVSYLMRNGSPLDPGWARRLCSGSILQFVTREDFFENDIPSLGFYGHREYLLQSYSCPASPFLMFLPYICIGLDENSPFWTATENEGIWPELGDKTITSELEKPGMVIVNHGKTGASEIISGKVYYDDPYYSKLAFSTDFPLEDTDPMGGTSMHYNFRSLDPRDLRGDDINVYLTGQKVEFDPNQVVKYTAPESIIYNGIRDEVIYRQLIMRTPPNNGVGYVIDLADIVIPGGVIRVDRSRLGFGHELTVGHYGLPHIEGEKAIVKEYKEEGKMTMTASIKGRQVALISYNGWDELRANVHTGRNAESDDSTVLYAYRKREEYNPAMELMITVMLHKTDDTPWTEEELSPIKDIEIVDIAPTQSMLAAKITMNDGKVYNVDFKDIDGYRMC